MADLIIKPSSGNNLVVQGGDSSPAITVGNTGLTTFAENTTLSGTANNIGTTTAGALSSGVTFPSGQIIGGKMLANKALSAEIASTSTSMTNSGITASYTPIKSSDTSWLRVNFHTAMQQNSGNLSETDCTMQGTSSSTTYANANSLGAEGGYNNRTNNQNDNTEHITWVYHVASSPVEAQTPSALTSYVAGTPYYFRLFYKTNSGTRYFCHATSYWNFWIEEIMI